jgi:hypothetical protein
VWAQRACGQLLSFEDPRIATAGRRVSPIYVPDATVFGRVGNRAATGHIHTTYDADTSRVYFGNRFFVKKGGSR